MSRKRTWSAIVGPCQTQSLLDPVCLTHSLPDSICNGPFLCWTQTLTAPFLLELVCCT